MSGEAQPHFVQGGLVARGVKAWSWPYLRHSKYKKTVLDKLEIIDTTKWIQIPILSRIINPIQDKVKCIPYLRLKADRNTHSPSIHT